MKHKFFSVAQLDAKLTTLALLLLFVSPSLLYVLWTLNITFPFTMIFIFVMIPVVLLRVFQFLARPGTATVQKLLLWFAILLIGVNILIHNMFPPEYWDEVYFSRVIVLSLIFPIFMIILTSDACRRYQSVLLSCKAAWVVLTATVVFGVMQANIKTGNYFLFFRNWENDSTFNYQNFGDMLGLISVLLLPSIKKFKIEFFTISFIAIFLCYSRSALVCFALATFITLAVRGEIKASIRPGAFFRLSAIFLILMIVSPLSFQGLEIALSRLDVFIGLEDASRAGRMEIETQVWEGIGGEFLFGKFLYELDGLGEGAYIHNFFSYLLSYGLLPFSLLLALIASSLFSGLKSARMSDFHAGILAVVIFATASAFFFRSHVWYLLWFSLGLASSIRRIRVPNCTIDFKNETSR